MLVQKGSTKQEVLIRNFEKGDAKKEQIPNTDYLKMFIDVTNFTDELLSTEWKESELENDELKNYKA